MDQNWLFPPSPQDWLPDGHLVYFLMDVSGKAKAAMWVCKIECNLSSARSGSESVLKRIFCGIEGLERN